MKITWDTEVNAPCCPGQIVAEDGRSILIQTDYDFPGIATTFGWDKGTIQIIRIGNPDWEECEHYSTDGTIDCPDCGINSLTFIDSAREFLENNDGATVEDPGYFD